MSVKVITEVQTGVQIKPVYYAYEGGFAHINRCEDCEAVGLYEDLHTVDVCPYCGGKVKSFGSGRWSGSWGQTGMFMSGWSDGAWEKRIGIEKEV